MGRTVIVVVAPTGGWGRGENNPVQPQRIAADVIRCAQAGAAVVHLHARDEEGKLTPDLTAFDQAVQTITDACGGQEDAARPGHMRSSFESETPPK